MKDLEMYEHILPGVATLPGLKHFDLYEDDPGDLVHTHSGHCMWTYVQLNLWS